MTARDAILNRVRAALDRKVGPGDAPKEAPLGGTAHIDAHLAARPIGLQPPRDWEPELRFRTRASACWIEYTRTVT